MDFASLSRESIRRIEVAEGRRPRVLVAILGADGNDQEALLVATGLSDLGFDVDVGSRSESADEIARQAVENDVHFISIGATDGGFATLLPALGVALSRLGREDILLIVRAAVSAADQAMLHEQGVAAVFEPGMPLVQMAFRMLDLLETEPATDRAMASNQETRRITGR